MEKRDNEDVTEFTIRRLLADEAEKCAQIAQDKATVLGEPSVGASIAKAIRARHQD